MPDFQARKQQNQTSQEPPGFRHGEVQNENSVHVNFEYINTTQKTGEIAEAYFNGNEFKGFLIHQDLDVAGGMVANCEMLGFNWSGVN